MSDNTVGGIYIILNVKKAKAYVGQAKNFNDRTHLDDLIKRLDPCTSLQEDYENEEEFVYFTPKILKDKSKKQLNRYEKMYMTLMEELGFALYNSIPKRENRTWEKLGVSIREQKRLKKTITCAFLRRFKIIPEKLAYELSPEEREIVLDSYLNFRNEEIQKFKKNRYLKQDIFMFNRQRAKNIFESKETSYRSLPLDELIFSVAGNYLGDGLDQIISYENDIISKAGYCLWTIANNAVCVTEVRKRCRECKKKGKDTYVLFHYTPSTTYSYNQPNQHEILPQYEERNLTEEEISFLHFEEELGEKKRLSVPKFIDTTSASNTSAAAFVIQEFQLLKESVIPQELKQKCSALRKRTSDDAPLNLTKPKEYNRSTYYFIFDDKDSINDTFTDRKLGREITFVGKLAPPYIIRLTNK